MEAGLVLIGALLLIVILTVAQSKGSSSGDSGASKDTECDSLISGRSAQISTLTEPYDLPMLKKHIYLSEIKHDRPKVDSLDIGSWMLSHSDHTYTTTVVDTLKEAGVSQNDIVDYLVRKGIHSEDSVMATRFSHIAAVDKLIPTSLHELASFISERTGIGYESACTKLFMHQLLKDAFKRRL
ncbi:MAG: hypothetical protein DRG83_03805 [Deltaproteobacteria bacterium]|nr:MAG: hypothetical protein DRG83_03805 [Deltaproteobacteria bacterium]